MTNLVVEWISPEGVDVGDGIRIAKAWTVVVGGAGSIRVEAVFDQHLRRAAAASVPVDRGGDGHEVTAIALRGVRVQEIVRLSAIEVTGVEGTDGAYEPLSNYLTSVRAEANRAPEQEVAVAARLYRVAMTVSLAPLKLISTQLGVSVSTATRIMKRARDAGRADDLVVRETYNRTPVLDAGA